MKEEIGARLREERSSHSIPQAILAEQLGISRHTQMAWEKGEQVPNAIHLNQLHSLGFDVLFILTGTRLEQTTSALDRYAESWQALDEVLQAKGIHLTAAKKRQAADALYQASTGELSTSTNFASILADIAAA
ncbi:helix-turn-helix transcriptional regulator [Alcaligenaceae bacterium SJ-26]|nr:helix-turn-helix transcriptional regulator [Alcaligenaceae bacterium SJ-26]